MGGGRGGRGTREDEGGGGENKGEDEKETVSINEKECFTMIDFVD